MQRALLLDVVVAECASVFKLLSRKNKPLLVGRNSLLVLNLALHILNSVRGLNLQRYSLACEGFHENLHGTARTHRVTETEIQAPNKALALWNVGALTTSRAEHQQNNPVYS